MNKILTIAKNSKLKNKATAFPKILGRMQRFGLHMVASYQPVTTSDILVGLRSRAFYLRCESEPPLPHFA